MAARTDVVRDRGRPEGCLRRGERRQGGRGQRHVPGRSLRRSSGIHPLVYQQNLGCEAAAFLAALNNEDPGAVTITTRFFELPNEAIQVKRVSLRLGGRSRSYKCFIIASPLPRYHQRRGTRGLGFRRPQPTTVHVNNPGEIA